MHASKLNDRAGNSSGSNRALAASAATLAWQKQTQFKLRRLREVGL
jgi:hypothetical protein